MLSTRPKNYIGEVAEWDRAEEALKEALDGSGKEWSLNAGDGAFYGPKIDIILKDSDGKEHQTATIQLDFQLPVRFGLVYQTATPQLERGTNKISNSELVTPVIIHRAIFGSLERFMALLIEHYNGRWPFWLSPRQAIVLPVANTDEIISYAKRVQRTISGIGESTPGDSSTATAQTLGRRIFGVDIDTSRETLGKKVQAARRMNYNQIIVVGQKNVASQTVTLTTRSDEKSEDGQLVKPVPQELSAAEVYDLFVDLERKYI